MELTIECNTCAKASCHRKESIKRTGTIWGVLTHCLEYKEPQPLKVRMVEVAMVTEIYKYGRVKNISRVLRV